MKELTVISFSVIKVCCDKGIEFGPKLSSKTDTQNLTARKMFPFVVEQRGTGTTSTKLSTSNNNTGEIKYRCAVPKDANHIWQEKKSNNYSSHSLGKH